MTAIIILLVVDIIQQTIFFIVNRLKLKNMADQSAAIEGLVQKIKDDATIIKDKLTAVISNDANTITDESLKDLQDAVNGLDAIANPPATDPAPETTDQP